jgi:hypothetical protein
MSETCILIRLLWIYLPRISKFGSTSEFFLGGGNPPNPPHGTPLPVMLTGCNVAGVCTREVLDIPLGQRIFHVRNSGMLLSWLRFSYIYSVCLSRLLVLNPLVVAAHLQYSPRPTKSRKEAQNVCNVRGRLFLNVIYFKKEKLQYCRKMKFGKNVIL